MSIYGAQLVVPKRNSRSAPSIRDIELELDRNVGPLPLFLAAQSALAILSLRGFDPHMP
jgi:hypothetical protein